MPNLAERGWSIHRLAVEANVDFHTVNDYMKGRTQPNRSTRKQLAEALGIPVQQLPE
jgi:ribosome-binding protein aMBF1 (putative translation factor)